MVSRTQAMPTVKMTAPAGKVLKRLAAIAVLLLCLSLVPASSGAASRAPVVCTGEMFGATIDANLVVPESSWCSFQGIVTGNVIVQEAGWFRANGPVTVEGNFLAEKSSDVGISTINVQGNVIAVGGGFLFIAYDAHVGGDVIAVGTPLTLYKGTSVDGNVIVVGARGQLIVGGPGRIGGNLIFLNNPSDVSILGQLEISRNLICFGNASVTLDADIAVGGMTLGQCRA